MLFVSCHSILFCGGRMERSGSGSALNCRRWTLDLMAVLVHVR